MNQTTYTIGTRGSLLALTQCLQFRAELERSSGHKFDLKIIQTEGDENTSAPLWQLDGKDFFTKELDAALLKGEVDLVVHSYKDLGSERPEGITLGAITQRKFPHDILFMRTEVVQNLQKQELEEIIVGTSSPRRMTNLESSLYEVLPFGKNVSVKTKNLRGNVNTRIAKLKAKEYDAIVLALPGIERLAQGLPAKGSLNSLVQEKHGLPDEILANLLKDLSFMILPLSLFPAAASQGALGVECLEKNSDLLNILKPHNHVTTIQEVKIERKRFAEFGGGCHLAVGITAKKTQAGLRETMKGEVDQKTIFSQKMEATLLPDEPIKKAFIGLSQLNKFETELSSITFVRDQIFEKKVFDQSKNETQNIEDKDLLIASPSALKFGKELLKGKSPVSLWSSGTKTMKLLAQEGYWVNGSADSLGEIEAQSLRKSAVVDLFLGPQTQWLVMTNDSAESELGETLPLYSNLPKSENLTEEFLKEIRGCAFYYWTSPKQYLWYKSHTELNPVAIHSCGLGKTYSELKKEKDLKLTPLSSMSELKNYLKQHSR